MTASEDFVDQRVAQPSRLFKVHRRHIDVLQLEVQRARACERFGGVVQQQVGHRVEGVRVRSARPSGPADDGSVPVRVGGRAGQRGGVEEAEGV